MDSFLTVNTLENILKIPITFLSQTIPNFIKIIINNTNCIDKKK